MLNGIEKLAEREDLLGRCLIFNMKRIHKEEIESRYDVANTQHTTLTEYEGRKERLVDMYVKGIIKEDVFEAKNKELDDLIEKTKQANKATQDLDRN